EAGPGTDPAGDLLVDLGVVEHGLGSLRPTTLEHAGVLGAVTVELDSEKSLGALTLRRLDAQLVRARGQGDGDEPRADQLPQPRRDQLEQRSELELARKGVADLVQRLELA